MWDYSYKRESFSTSVMIERKAYIVSANCFLKKKILPRNCPCQTGYLYLQLFFCCCLGFLFLVCMCVCFCVCVVCMCAGMKDGGQRHSCKVDSLLSPYVGSRLSAGAHWVVSLHSTCPFNFWRIKLSDSHELHSSFHLEWRGICDLLYLFIKIW